MIRILFYKCSSNLYILMLKFRQNSLVIFKVFPYSGFRNSKKNIHTQLCIKVKQLYQFPNRISKNYILLYMYKKCRFYPGKNFRVQKHWLKRAKPVYLAVQVTAPARLHFSIFDFLARKPPLPRSGGK